MYAHLADMQREQACRERAWTENVVTAEGVNVRWKMDSAEKANVGHAEIRLENNRTVEDGFLEKNNR